MRTIPDSGIFQVTEENLTEYITVYGNLYGNGNIGKPTNKKFARRLAGRTLLSLLSDRGAKYTEIKSGICYLIGCKSFLEHFKVGITLNLSKRLTQYQTYSPFRDYFIHKYDFVLDKASIEKQMLAHPLITKEKGEWIKATKADEVFLQLTK